MHSQKLKNKIYINFLLIIAIFGIIYLFIYPQYSGSGNIYHPDKGISDLLKDKKDYANAINVAKNYSAKLSKSNTDYFNAINTLPIEKLNKILPTTVDPVYVIYELSKIASRPESSMILASPKFTDDGLDAMNTNKKFNTLTVSFNLEGTYSALKAFLKNLETSERIYNVTSLTFNSTSESRTNTSIKYTLTVETYYLKQK